MRSNSNEKVRYDIISLVKIMAKYKGKDASELGGYVVFGVIVGFFLLIFYFIKLIVEETKSIIKNNKKKERQKLREESVTDTQEQHIEKTLEDERLDDLNSLIQEAEEMYDEALFHDSDVDLDDEYMRLYNIKNELEDEGLIDISDDQVEMLEEELTEIIDNMNEKVEEAKEKEDDLRAVSALLVGKYLFHEEDDEDDE